METSRVEIIVIIAYFIGMVVVGVLVSRKIIKRGHPLKGSSREKTPHHAKNFIFFADN
ncbi:MAG: hypothetical protein JRL30_10050 [Deltaproteobacteria bacterium]|nr:hypothetical protein [Deltaproteobacteria bacterium]